MVRLIVPFDQVTPGASQRDPGKGDVQPLVLRNVSKAYRSNRNRKRLVKAVESVSFTVEPGRSVGLVGASGSGKSTIAKMVTGTERPYSGEILLGDLEIGRLRPRALTTLYKRVQMVFQDPYGALNPVHTIEYTLSRPSINHLRCSAAEAKQRTLELLERVGLTPPHQFLVKLPHQLSGGQRQRVVIARALAAEPELLVADEPVSMLDVSLRAGILRLLADLQREHGLSMLYITHDLMSARIITDELLVLNQGKIVERGETAKVLQHPQDPYTIKLIDALTAPGAGEEESG